MPGVCDSRSTNGFSLLPCEFALIQLGEGMNFPEVVIPNNVSPVHSAGVSAGIGLLALLPCFGQHADKIAVGFENGVKILPARVCQKMEGGDEVA